MNARTAKVLRPPQVQASAPVMLLEPDAKRFSGLQARCALRGVQLNVTTDDRDRPLFVAVKWAMTATFTQLDEVAAWVGKLDGLSE